MAAVSKATVLSLSDSLAKHVIDLQTLTGGSTAAIIAGEATTLGKIAALNDASQQYALLDGFTAAMQNEASYLTSLSFYNNLIDTMRHACIALDGAVGGLPTFVAANQPLLVAPQFFDQFNRAMISINKNTGLLSAWMAYGAVIANMAQITMTGATTGTFVAGTSQSTYGNAPLSIKNIGSTTGAGSSVFTVTYNAYNASGVLQTGLTATATMPTGSANGTVVALSASAAGVQVTGISVTTGNTGDVIAVVSTATRTPAY